MVSQWPCGVARVDWATLEPQRASPDVALSAPAERSPVGRASMPDFQVVAPFQPTGDQPTAIEELVESVQHGNRYQTLLGVTGSGKTYTVAQVVERLQRPTLVLAPNKTLAAQLYAEYKEFFPNNAVEYFVS